MVLKIYIGDLEKKRKTSLKNYDSIKNAIYNLYITSNTHNML